MRGLRIASIPLMLALAGSAAYAAPQFILYQGRYLDNGAAPAGSVSMEFRITNGNAVACGTPLPAANLFWTSNLQSIATSSGVFSYRLGLQADQVAQDRNFLAVNWAAPATAYYVDVCVAGAGLTPHEPIGSSVYALFSSSAGGLGSAGDAVVQADAGSGGTGAIRLRTGPSDRVYVANAGNVGIGTTSPGTFSLATSSGISVASGAYAGFFAGNGAGLSGASGTDSSKLAKIGDMMTGQLTLAGSTLTVAGAGFSVGASTFVVSGGRVGIGTISPSSAFHVIGPMTVNVRAVVGASAITDVDSYVAADATAGGFALTLPPASAATVGRLYYLSEAGCVNNIMVAASGADTVSDISGIGAAWRCTSKRFVGLTATSWLAY